LELVVDQHPSDPDRDQVEKYLAERILEDSPEIEGLRLHFLEFNLEHELDLLVSEIKTRLGIDALYFMPGSCDKEE
jgi:hypothetical protein